MKRFIYPLFVMVLVYGTITAQHTSQRPVTLPDGMNLNVQLPLNDKQPVTSPGATGGNRDITYVIDQDQPLDEVYMAAFIQGDLAQSFKPAASMMCGAGIMVFDINTTESGTITIGLYDALPNAGGTLLASGTVPATVTTVPQWVDVYWTGVPVTPGNTYYLTFNSEIPNSGVRGSVGNPYPDGMVFANPGFQPFINYDYTFHTFTCDAAPLETPVSNWAVYLSVSLMVIAAAWIFIRRRS